LSGVVYVGQAVDKVISCRALRVAVVSAVLGPGRVGRRSTTVLGHLAEVQGSIHSAPNLGQVDVESELLVQQVEQLVCFACRVEEVKTWAGVGGDVEGDGEGIAGSGDTRGCVVDTFEGAILRAAESICTDATVPRSTCSFAVRVAADLNARIRRQLQGIRRQY